MPQMKIVTTFLMLFLVSVLLAMNCNKHPPYDIPTRTWAGYWEDATLPEFIELVDEDTHITLITRDDKLTMCFDGWVTIHFLGDHDAVGPVCETNTYDPTKKKLTVKFNWNGFSAPVDVKFAGDAVKLSFYDLAWIWLERVE